MRHPRRFPRRSCSALFAALGLGLAGCGQGTVEANGAPSHLVSVQVGRELELTLQTIGPGEYASPPLVSSGAVRFLDVRLVTPAVPAGPTQRFRFEAVRAGEAVIEFHHTGQSPTIEDTYSTVITPGAVTLEGHGVRLEPLGTGHLEGLIAAAEDGHLWELWFTSVPFPTQTSAYIADALAGQEEGHMLPWAVRDLSTDTIVGSTRYHDIMPKVDRVEIGYTWYAASRHRTHINTTCKLLLLSHAFDTLGCQVVGLRTDHFNFRSQRAIEALGAKKDGVIRHHHARPNGTVRDTVMYSILASEWPDVRRHLEHRLTSRGGGSGSGASAT